MPSSILSPSGASSFLLKGSHIYQQAGQFDISITTTGPGVFTYAQQTAVAVVANMPSAFPGTPPDPISGTPPLAPTDVGLSLTGAAPIYSYAGLGFQNNVAASLGGSVNGQQDPNATDFRGWINWGDSNQWTAAVITTGNSYSSGQFAVEGSHVYSLPGQYSIVVYAIGPDGTTASTLTDTAIVQFSPAPPAQQPPATSQQPPVTSPPTPPAVSGTSPSQSTPVVTSTPAPTPNPGNGPTAWLTVANGLTHSAEYYSNFVTAAYQQYLGRQPDANGLAYWVNQMQQGLSDERLEAGFIGSPEYIADHGGAGANWVQGLYQDLLGRAPAADEVAYWVNNLNNGMSPADVAFGFASSPEREGQRVTADYQRYLGRAPSATEVGYWVNTFLAGTDNETVVASFVASQEFFQSQGQNNVNDWLFSAYEEILNRPPDATGEAYWLGVLDG